SSQPEQNAALENQVAAVEGRLQKLETAGKVAHTIIDGGSPVILLGYPTGVDAILARTGAATLQAIAASSKGDPKQVMEELARHHLIKPIVTQGTHRRRTARQDRL
ncbi:MAG TPA: hypothetical protein VH139_01945, partial [Acidobacteriaceae bacterium]|nr:hypothetical protein [Acidobacteriaceae bacterium]